MEDIFCSIVIPFRNEEKNLEILLPCIAENISKERENIELLLVDDCSTDNSLEICKKLIPIFKNCEIIELSVPSGQSGAFKEAFKKAKGEFLIRMDADLQDNPKDIKYFIEKFNSGSDLTMGLRECRKHRRLFRVISNIYDLMIIILIDTPLHSNSGSFVGFRTSLVKNIPWIKNDHRYLPLIAIRRGAKQISEIIVTHSPRKYGESKYKPYRKLINGIPEVLLFLMRLKKGFYDV